MAILGTLQTAAASALLVVFSLIGIRTLHIFAAQNGLFEHFLKAIDKRKMPSGLKIDPMTTNGRFPKIDWQIVAPAVFVLTFTENLLHPDTTLSGFLFLGSWAPAWTLIVLESLRNCNQGTLASHILIPGLLIFNHSHAVATPAYLALHLLLAPSVTSISAEDLTVDQSHLVAIPGSFVLGYIVPIILLALPAPKVVSWRFKFTVSGWYQQWSLYITLFHYSFLYFIRGGLFVQQGMMVSAQTTLMSLRITYGLAFAMAAIPHWVTYVILFTAQLCPSLFDDKKVSSMIPSSVLVATLPSKTRKARDMAQGFMWLIQWDYLMGTFAMIVWSLVLYWNARETYGVDDTWFYVVMRFLGYLFVGGPGGLPVGIMWERDEWAFAARFWSEVRNS